MAIHFALQMLRSFERLLGLNFSFVKPINVISKKMVLNGHLSVPNFGKHPLVHDVQITIIDYALQPTK